MVENSVMDKSAVRVNGNPGNALRDSGIAVYERPEPSRPLDRVRWGAVLAGLVTTLSTLVVLSVLGLAIGLTTFETGDRLSNFGMGAGIWGAISTFVAFMLGGWVAARSAGVSGRTNAMVNGAMVWAIAIPLVMYLLGSGVGSIMNMATDAAAATTNVIAAAVPADVNAAADAVQTQAQQVDPATVNNAVDNVAQNAGQAAWGTLVALLLGLLAAGIGGLMGERKQLESIRTA